MSRLKMSDIETTGIILSRQRTTKAQFRLRGCAGWSAPLLFAYGKSRFSHAVAHMTSGLKPVVLKSRTPYEPPYDKTNEMTFAPSEDSDQSDQSLRCSHEEASGPWLPLSALWRLIWLGGCPGLSESSLGAQVILLVLSCDSSYS